MVNRTTSWPAASKPRARVPTTAPRFLRRRRDERAQGGAMIPIRMYFLPLLHIPTVLGHRVGRDDGAFGGTGQGAPLAGP